MGREVAAFFKLPTRKPKGEALKPRSNRLENECLCTSSLQKYNSMLIFGCKDRHRFTGKQAEWAAEK
jgi:hypothetical protein